MSITLSTPITGGAQSGVTSSSFTIVTDTAPDNNGKQVAVTAISGTGTAGMTVNSVSSPFTITATRPKSLKTLGVPNPVTGAVSQVPRNTYKVITRKGVIPLAGQAAQTMLVTTTIEVPAGSDNADPLNVRAALAAHIGALDQTSAGIGDTSVTGVI